MADVVNLCDFVVVQPQLSQLRKAWEIVDAQQASEAKAQCLYLTISQVRSLFAGCLHVVLELQHGSDVGGSHSRC